MLGDVREVVKEELKKIQKLDEKMERKSYELNTKQFEFLKELKKK